MITDTGSTSSYTIEYKHPGAFSTDEAEYIARSLPTEDPDFGKMVSTCSAYCRVIGKYVLVRPLEMVTYRNGGIYTTRLAAFDSIAGFGASSSISQSEALSEIAHLRGVFGPLSDDECSLDAIRLRNVLTSYLQPICN